MHVVVPLDLDGFVFLWDGGKADDLRARNVADFVGWRDDEAKYQRSLESLVAALGTNEAGREEPPEPKL